MPAVTVVVLTMGDRPAELAAAVESARRQAVDLEIVLVINGGDPDRSLADIVVEPGENLGIPEGRNRGAAAGTGALICFLDDDGALDGDVFGPAIAAFAANDRLGVIGLRVVDEDGKTARRHVPGLRKDAERSASATAFPGGACLVRRTAFDAVGGLCGPFHYGLEETDLAWRLIDARWEITYRADLTMRHPRTSPTRHPEFFFHTARNRVCSLTERCRFRWRCSMSRTGPSSRSAAISTGQGPYSRTYTGHSQGYASNPGHVIRWRGARSERFAEWGDHP